MKPETKCALWSLMFFVIVVASGIRALIEGEPVSAGFWALLVAGNVWAAAGTIIRSKRPRS